MRKKSRKTQFIVGQAERCFSKNSFALAMILAHRYTPEQRQQIGGKALVVAKWRISNSLSHFSANLSQGRRLFRPLQGQPYVTAPVRGNELPIARVGQMARRMPSGKR